MTKSELIERLSCRFPGLSAKDVRISVEHILKGIAGALSARQRIEIRDFGSFCLTYRQARVGRNPRTGAQVTVPAKTSPHFKAGKALRQRVADKANRPLLGKRYRLAELLAEVPPGTRFKEIDFGPAVGREIL